MPRLNAQDRARMVEEIRQLLVIAYNDGLFDSKLSRQLSWEDRKDDYLRRLNSILTPAEPRPPTYEEYAVRAATRIVTQRNGQHAFNVLCEMRPDISEKVRGVYQLDPFYRDEFLPRFHEFVKANW